MNSDNQMGQRIRRAAARESLVVQKSRKDGKWYFSDYERRLLSPQDGMTLTEACEWIANTVSSTIEVRDDY